MSQTLRKPSKATAENQNSTRAALLATVRKLITERGDVEFSLSDIAKESGKNSALVSYHFGGKEQLLLATLDDSSESLIRPLKRLQNSDLPAPEKLKRHLVGLITTHAKNPHLNILSRVLLRRSSDETAQKIAAKFVEPIIEFQKAVLDQGKSDGVFRTVDPLTFYLTAVGSIDMLFAAKATIQYGFGRKRMTKKDVDQFADELCQILISGITA